MDKQQILNKLSLIYENLYNVLNDSYETTNCHEVFDEIKLALANIAEAYRLIGEDDEKS